LTALSVEFYRFNSEQSRFSCQHLRHRDDPLQLSMFGRTASGCRKTNAYVALERLCAGTPVPSDTAESIYTKLATGDSLRRILRLGRVAAEP
jgi:hypothetical protein